MGRISKSADNIFPIPSGASVTRGYVYMNVSSSRKVTRSGKSSTTHDKVAIGVVACAHGEDWKVKRLMYANEYFHEILNQIEQSEKNDRDPLNDSSDASKGITDSGIEKVKQALKGVPPRSKLQCVPKLSCQRRDEAIFIGLYIVAQQIAAKTGLISILVAVFGEVIAMLLLDLALYAIDKKELVYQFMPDYARDHAIFSDQAFSDGYLGQLLLREVTLSRINFFKFLWANHVLEEEGQLYLCYDSTNVNSQCNTSRGIDLVQKGHAKDKQDLKQVNIDYVIRQSDGRPVSFNTFPGSIPDVSEAEEMFKFFDEVLKQDIPEEYKSLLDGVSESDIKLKRIEALKKILFVCDRGYISEKNLSDLDKKQFDYLLLLRGDTKISKWLINKHFHRIKSRLYEIRPGVYGDTVEERLYPNDKKERYCHIIYNDNLRKSHEAQLRAEIAGLALEIENHIKRKTAFTSKQLEKYSQYYALDLEPVVKKNSRGKESIKSIITGFREDYKKIDHAMAQCGFFVLISSKKMTVKEALEIYSKRDRVEKVFLALKSFLGMDCFSAHSSESIHIRSLIWFIATVIYTSIFSMTSSLRANERNKKRYSTEGIIELLKHVKTIFNLVTLKYNSAFKMCKENRKIFESFGITEFDVYEFASSIDFERDIVEESGWELCDILDVF